MMIRQSSSRQPSTKGEKLTDLIGILDIRGARYGQ